MFHVPGPNIYTNENFIMDFIVLLYAHHVYAHHVYSSYEISITCLQ